MKNTILIEEEEYPLSQLEEIYSFQNTRNFYRKSKKPGFGIVTHVGYLHKLEPVQNGRKRTGSIVFMLPKVFRGLKNDIESQYIENGYKEPDWLKRLIWYFYNGLKEYRRRVSNSKYFDDEKKESAIELRAKNGAIEYTFLDLYISFSAFYEKNKNLILLKHLQSISNRVTKPKWEKTIRRSNPLFIENDQPIYLKIVNKKKEINSDEELIVIFISILSYLNREIGYHFRHDTVYNIIKGQEFEKLKKIGKARLRKIKHKYFSDILKRMFWLCEIFFELESVADARECFDYLVVNKYNQVFEDMIDKLLVNENYDEKDEYGLSLSDLKFNEDGKIIDHVYADPSLVKNFFNSDKVYFIADSKYYSPDENALSETEVVKAKGKALYKQFTYAKNLTQFNVNIFNKDKDSSVKIRDLDITEGYDILPNYFIYGYLKDKMDYVNEGLEVSKTDRRSDVISYHWKYRLFDRDTLYIQHHKINFLYLLKSYLSTNSEYVARQSEKIRSHLKTSFINFLRSESGFSFFRLKFENKESIQSFVEKNFKILNGKTYSFSTNNSLSFILIIALHEKDSESRNNLKEFLIESGILNQDGTSFYSFKFGEYDEVNEYAPLT